MTTTLLLTALAAAVFAVTLLVRPRTASAHCDTMEGPAVLDGVRALETGNVNHALKWVPEDAGAELTAVFGQALATRQDGDRARAVADRWFLENLVRLHRAGEGAAYTGLQPEGTPVDARVRAADEAVATGSLAPLEGLVPADQRDELARRLALVLQRKDHDVDDLDAGRAYLEAYVAFFKLAEGHEHEHHHEHVPA
jgi:hypothetical protein